MRRHSYFRWSDESVRLLRRLYCQGLSFGKISYTLGCTRPAAIAKAERLGITDRPSPILTRQTEPSAAAEMVEEALAEADLVEAGDAPDGWDDDAEPNGEMAPRRRADLSDLPGFDNFGVDLEDRWRFGGWSGVGGDYWQPKACQFLGPDPRPDDRPGSWHDEDMCGQPVVADRAYCRRHLQICTIDMDMSPRPERRRQGEDPAGDVGQAA